MQFDVVIIGSGPAGCAAAMSCSRYGLGVLIITSKSENIGAVKRLQPAESVHPGLVSVMSQLNAAHCITAVSVGVYEGIAASGQFSALGEDENGPWLGHHIDREIFDNTFVQTAAKQGVTVWFDDEVKDIIVTDGRAAGIITKSGKRVSFTYLVDASGAKRTVGKKLRFKESFYSPPLVTWTGVSSGIPATSTLFTRNYTQFIPYADGWTWLAPQLPESCTWTRLGLKGKQKFDVPDELRGYPVVSEIKTANRRWRVFRPVCREGVLLCGDAAGIIDPAAGQGILNAIVSATMAAKAINACISNPVFEAFYLAKYDEWFMSDYADKVGKLRHFYELHGIKVFE